MGLQDSFPIRDLDKTLAAVGLILSALMVILGGMTSRFMYLIVGGLILMSCLLWLVIRNSHTFKFHLPDSRTLTIFFTTCFLGLYILSVLSVYLRPELYERPLPYFILTALMAGVTACEIFTSDRRHAGLILIQILWLGVNIAWSQLLIFPSLLGVDPWYHSALTGGIVNEGFIPEGCAYSKLPLFHLMIAGTSLIAGPPYKFASMVSVSLGQIICNAVFLFLITNYLFRNHRIGLLAALMVIIANHHIFMSYWSIPNAFAAVFIPIALYLLFFRFKKESRSKSALLIIMALAPIILTHTITALCMAILLFVTWGSLAVLRHYNIALENYVPLSIPITFTIAMLAWWTFASDSIGILVDLIRSGFSIDFFEYTPAEFQYYATPIPFGEQLFNDLGMYLFFSFSLIGLFYMVSRKGSSSTFAIAWVGIIPLIISFVSLISGHTVIEQRWWYFAQILLSIPLAVTIYLLGTIRKDEWFLYLYNLMFGFVVVLSFFMIMSPIANVDNHIFSPITGYTFNYTQSEVVASEFFALRTVSALSSDYYYCASPSGSVFIHEHQITRERLLNLDGSLIFGKFEHDESIKILRSKFYQESLKNGGFRFRIRPDLNAYMSNSGFSNIYNNSAVTGYTG